VAQAASGSLTPPPRRRAAVLGSPIAHSLSPVLHRAAYAALGLTDRRYEAIELAEQELAGFMATLDASWSGLSLTMPLKRVVQPLLVSQSDLARQVGAVNTVVQREDGWHGFNTDVHGIVMAIREVAELPPIDAGLVIGGGATAASALGALHELGARRASVAVRAPQRASHLLEVAERLELDVDLVGLDAAAGVIAGLGPDAVVVATIPASAGAELSEVLVTAAAPDASPILLDVIYDPWPTPLISAWARAGHRCAHGMEMLLHQAEGQIRLMTGERVDIEVLRRAGLAELDRRAHAVVPRPAEQLFEQPAAKSLDQHSSTTAGVPPT